MERKEGEGGASVLELLVLGNLELKNSKLDEEKDFYTLLLMLKGGLFV